MSRLTRRATLGLLGAAALPMPFVRRARAEEPVVNIYNWANYIGEDTIPNFTAETGIEVVYDNFSSSEEAEAKLQTGGTGYDLVLMSSSSLPRLVPAGLFQPIDRSLLPLWDNLDPAILKLNAEWDADNAHSFPYAWGTFGISYNVDMVKERLPDADLSSLDLILKPENAAKLADCGISLLDSPEAVIRLAITYLGRDGNDLSAENIDAAVELLAGVRPHIRTFDNSTFLNTLPNKEICVANTFAGDYATAKARAAEAGVDIDLAYFVPKSGSPVWVDSFCIPSDAPHAANAHAFLAYLLRPEVIAEMTNYTNYASANLASRPFVAPEILADPAVFPDAEVMSRLWTPDTASDDELRLITRAWRSVKSG
jgi:putrescine transport system substrate-binding protein